MNEMHAEPPFLGDYTTSKTVAMTSTAKSKHIFKSQTAIK